MGPWRQLSGHVYDMGFAESTLKILSPGQVTYHEVLRTLQYIREGADQQRKQPG
jgi:hypothetical protein